MNDEPTPEEKNAVYEEAHLHNAVASVLPLLREMPEALDLLRRLTWPGLTKREINEIRDSSRKLIYRVEEV